MRGIRGHRGPGGQGRSLGGNRWPLTERNVAMRIIRSPATEGVFEMTYKPLALAAATLMAGFLSLGGAQGANVMTGSAAPLATPPAQDGNIQQVKYKYYWG